MGRFDLRLESNRFAADLCTLLNNTVCHGIRLTAIAPRGKGYAVIGYEIGPDDLMPTRGIALTLSEKAPSAYLNVHCRLVPDDTEGEHLMVQKSVVSLCLDQELHQELFHYDYERDKPDEYPEAHIQMCFTPPLWAELATSRGMPNRPFGRLHLPVGGRRNRPTLEDIVEFLVREDIADGHDGWNGHVAAGRKRFLQSQLRAAVRRDPETAKDELRRLKHI